MRCTAIATVLLFSVSFAITFASPHHFCDGQIPTSLEVTFGIFQYDGNILGDISSYPLRVELPLSQRLSAFCQVELMQFDTILGDASTFGIGGGMMYKLLPEGDALPFDYSLRGAVDHYFEKEEDFIVIESSTEVEVAGIASKIFKGVKGTLWDIIPYASLNFAILTGDDSDTALTFGLGGRARFSNKWSFILEMDMGDRDGWGIGGSYIF